MVAKSPEKRLYSRWIKLSRWSTEHQWYRWSEVAAKIVQVSSHPSYILFSLLLSGGVWGGPATTGNCNQSSCDGQYKHIVSPFLFLCVVCCCVYIDILLEVLFTLSTTESFSCSLGLQVVPFEAEEQKIINIATVSWGERKRPSRSQCIKYLCRYQ